MTLDLPDLENIPPEDWLRRLDQIRDELITELADLLRTTDDPEVLADRLKSAFQQLELKGEATGANHLAVDVELDERDVVCRHAEASNARRLHLDNTGEWRVEVDADRQLDRDVDSTDDDPDHHRRLARQLLELLPWWSKHAFTPESRS